MLVLGASPVNAQIVPDATLPDNSIVTPSGAIFQIDGGTTAGSNLFHSFQEFSIPTGNEAFFNNATTIDNIVTRVTGGNISNIDGLIRANGGANLFLLNPNGIVFGPNARLDIGGSFLGTTANSIVFENGTEFSATGLAAPSLLTVSVPIGLQYGSDPGVIVNRSERLEVNPGRAIALVGGDLSLEGSLVNAPSGSIELGAVGAGTVKLDPRLSEGDDGLVGWLVIYPENFDRGNISLSKGAIASTSGESGGRLQVFGGSVTLTEQSQLLADTLGAIDGEGIEIDAINLQVQEGSIVGSSTFGIGAGGDLNIRVNESIKISGTGDVNPFIFNALSGNRLLSDRGNGGLFVGSELSGNSGNLNIRASQLNLGNGALIVADIYGNGRGGDIDIRATDIELDRSGISYSVFASGDASSLTIESQHLILRGSAFVDAPSFPGSTGRGGDIFISAEDIEIRDAISEMPTISRIATFALGDGQGGNISINTERLLLLNGGTINTENSLIVPFILLGGNGRSGNLNITASESVEVIGTAPTFTTSGLISSIGTGTANHQRAGDITIETGRFRVADGGRVSNSTFSIGSGGDIFIRASEFVELDGTASPIVGLQGIGSRARTLSGETAEASERLGNAGNITIITPELLIGNENVITTQSLGLSPGGDITILANSIRLSGSIIANTALGQGGDINLQVSNSIQLWDESQIDAEAGGIGDGGNITVNTEMLTLLENSRITANAFGGNGGNIRIFTRGIFQAPNSSITASSQLGIDGTVAVFDREFNPTSAIVSLSTELLDTANQINVACGSRDRENSFTITGRGGLPDSPFGPISPTRGWRDLTNYAELDSEEFEQFEQIDSMRKTIESTTSHFNLVEATGLVRHSSGSIHLVANPQQQLNFGQNCQS